MMRRLTDELRRFRADASGQIAIIFGLSSLLLMVAVGASVDLARAYQARQKLSEVATLACQYSNRDSVEQTANSTYTTNANGFQTYVNAVNSFAATSLASQNWGAGTPTGASGSAGAYFTATPATGGASTLPTNASVTMAANVPTAMMKLINVTTIPVHATINCAAPQQAAPPPLIGSEGFEDKTCFSICWTQPSGAAGTVGLTPTQTFPAKPSYTGDNGYKWYIVGYCLETDVTGIVNTTSPQGSQTAELDCDNGQGSGGNSSISTQIYMQAGTYELRYNYRGRVDYPNYDPAYICGSTVSDLSWASDTVEARGSGLRTNQINVYLDMNLNGTAPLHKTLDNTQNLAGSNLIDECVYSQTWVERSVRITVTTPANYWLSFAADGQSDSYGGQIDNIRMCPDKCSGTPQDNFPPTWLAAGNGGVNKLLFEDSFESPIYTQDPYTASDHSKSGNLANSNGTTVSTGCTINSSIVNYPSPPGWPCQAEKGWVTAPNNESVYWMQGAYKGNQYVSLQGVDGSVSSNRSINRQFLFDPGYYNVSYAYTSMVDFTSQGYIDPTCFASPASGGIYPIGYFPGTYGNTRYDNQSYYTNLATNIEGVFLSNGQLISTPIGSSSFGGATTYANPDGTTGASPTVAPDAVNWLSYNASAVNPVIDTCGYASGYKWLPRSVNVKITKPGFYWLTFSANGDPVTGTGDGPVIDDVKITALGSLYGSAPQAVQVPPSVVTTTAPTLIPVPNPQPDSTYYGPSGGQFNGFSIIADPQTPTAGP